MRLYRFINTDKKIDVVVVTDGSCEQKRVFITESPRGVIPAGSTNPSADEKAGSDAFLALGWKWNVGESVQHEELVAFAENNALTLTIEPQGLNEVVAVNAEWNDEKVNGRTPMEFTLADLGLDAKEDLNLVVMADAGVQKFEVVAKNSK